MIDKIGSPRDFFEHVVAVDVREFNGKPDDLRLAYHACISLLSLRDWVEVTHRGAAWHWQGNPLQWDGKNELQKKLESIHDEFRLITDVANASKHLLLNVKRRRTNAIGVSNVTVQSRSWSMAYTGGSLLDLVPNKNPLIITEDVVVIDDGGKLYDLRVSVESVSRVWAFLFTENHWL